MVETGLNVRSDLRQQFIWELTEQKQRKRTQTIDKEDRNSVKRFDLSFIQQLLLWMSFGYTIAIVSLINEMIFNILRISK